MQGIEWSLAYVRKSVWKELTGNPDDADAGGFRVEYFITPSMNRMDAHDCQSLTDVLACCACNDSTAMVNSNCSHHGSEKIELTI